MRNSKLYQMKNAENISFLHRFLILDQKNVAECSQGSAKEQHYLLSTQSHLKSGFIFPYSTNFSDQELQKLHIIKKMIKMGPEKNSKKLNHQHARWGSLQPRVPEDTTGSWTHSGATFSPKSKIYVKIAFSEHFLFYREKSYILHFSYFIW